MAGNPASLQAMAAGPLAAQSRGLGGVPAGDAPAGGGGPLNAAPQAAPMTTPQPMEGLRTAAMVGVGISRTLLEQALPYIGGSGSDEGKAIIKALNALSSFGPAVNVGPLIPAEIEQLVSALPQMGGGSPVQRAMNNPPPAAA